MVAVNDIAPLEHDEAMAVAEVEYDRFCGALERLDPGGWARPTECAGWDVKAVAAHVLGMMELDADGHELVRQVGAATQRMQRTGGFRIDALTAVQVEEHAHLDPGALLDALRAAAPRALAGRSRLTPEERAQVYDPGPPFGEVWTRGYLLDVVHTRDPWMHRIDIARATGTDPILTAEHDGRIVADVVADWARRHGQPFTLALGHPVNATFVAGDSGDHYEMDAVELCRVVSGRGTGRGLLQHEVPF